MRAAFRAIVTWASALFLLLATPMALAENVVSLFQNGDPANRVDVVFLGDGYTASEMGMFASDVSAVAQQFFAVQPIQDYQSYFNARRIEVVSNQSGADHPEIGSYRDTALGSRYNCNSIQRLICVDVAATMAIVNANLLPNEADVVIVLVNDPEYGGSGGAVAVASKNVYSSLIAVHEVGHSFGLLADEYEANGYPCNLSLEPPELNVTINANRNTIKWNQGGGPPSGWIESSTQVPTYDAVRSQPGLYEGARYCTNGMYRPSYDSLMRSLGVNYDAVNEELIVRRIYAYVSPIDSSAPVDSMVSTTVGAHVQFTVQTLDSSTGTVSVEWFVDGTLVGTGTAFELNAAALSIGNHQVTVRASDQTTKVRHDPYNVTVDSRTWTVSVAAAGGPSIFDPVPGSVLAGSAASFAWTAGGASVEKWWLYAGPTAGSNAYADSGLLDASTTSHAVAGLPLDGSVVHLTLFFRLTGQSNWQEVAATYTAATSTTQVPTYSLPAAGTTLSGRSQRFTWSANGASVTHWWLYLGNAPGGAQYFDSGNLGLATSVSVTGLPADGSTVYARLWYQTTDGSWHTVDASFIAATTSGALPFINSPLNTVPLPGETVTFTWSDAGAGATSYWLYVGDATHSTRYVDSGDLGTATSYSVSGLPADGSLVRVRLWYRLPGTSAYQYVEATYTASLGAPPDAATLVSPSGVLSTSTPTYTWQAEVGATWYYLWVDDTTGTPVRQWIKAIDAGCPSGTGTCATTPSAAVSPPGGWWIQTWGPGGYGPWSSGLTFTP